MNIRSLRKIWNYRLIEYQKKKRTSFVFGYPYWLTIDPASICNLRCRFCPTGQERGTRQQTVLALNAFKKIIRKLGPYLLHIDFCNWGEPFLNRDLLEMVTLAKRFGPTVKIDTNLNIPLSESDAEKIIRSGLDQMNMSVDGASQETYEVYRKKGDFSLAIENMKLLARNKKELSSPTPHLHWQFLVFRHNEHEIEKARAMAKEIGVDSIGFTAPFCDLDWVSRLDEYNNYTVKDAKVDFKAVHSACDWPWDGITINANGSVSPCCSVEDEKDDFDNFFRKPFWLLWNNRDYRTARRHIRDRKPSSARNACTRCDHIGASNHAPVRIPAHHR